jgi:lysophospholipase L1-like esterase
VRSPSRFDLIVVAAMLAVLGALVGLGVANRSLPATRAADTPGTAAAAARSAPPPVTVVAPTPSIVAPTTTVPPTTTSPSATDAGTVTAVGDSIMLDIQPYLEADLPGVQVDGVVSRQFETGIGVVQADRAAGTLGSILVVELGTNGSVTSADMDAMMQAAAGVKRVVFVNVDVPRPWEATDNAVLAAGVARYPGVAVLADWYTLSSPHPEWFTTDQVHLNPDGAQALAALITQYA